MEIRLSLQYLLYIYMYLPNYHADDFILICLRNKGEQRGYPFCSQALSTAKIYSLKKKWSILFLQPLEGSFKLSPLSCLSAVKCFPNFSCYLFYLLAFPQGTTFGPPLTDSNINSRCHKIIRVTISI